jgi:signal transduction histidine kinase
MSINIESRNFLYSLLKTYLDSPTEESLYEAYEWGKKLYLSKVSPDILIWLFLETKEILKKEHPVEMRDSEADFDKILLEIMAAYNLQFYQSLQMQKELEGTVKRLQEMDTMKNQFISTAAHELRTPLTAIKGFFELCQQEQGLSEDHLHYLEIIMRNVNRLELITHDLLDQQRLLTGKLTLGIAEHDLNNIVGQAVEEIKPLLDEKNQKINVFSESNTLIVEVDETRIIQVITNILSNASKFSPMNEDITIELFSNNGDLCVSITDKGIGISEEDQRKLFVPFPQIAKQDNYAGVGLGLSISKGLMNLQKGNLTCFSEGTGKGSTFTITIPNASKKKLIAEL